MTIEGLKNYKVTNRRYRNRRIGEFLKELHLTEGRNTGFKKILNALDKNGSPKPEFETDEDHSYFISRFFVREGFYDEDVRQEQDLSDRMSDKMSEQKESSVKSSVKIIEMMKNNSLVTAEQIASELNISLRAVEKQIRNLREKGQIVRVGADNGGHWEVKEK